MWTQPGPRDAPPWWWRTVRRSTLTRRAARHGGYGGARLALAAARAGVAGSGLRRKGRAGQPDRAPGRRLCNATQAPGGTSCAKNVFLSGGGGRWPIWRLVGKFPLRSPSGVDELVRTARHRNTDPGRTTAPRWPVADPPGRPKLSLNRTMNLSPGNLYCMPCTLCGLLLHNPPRYTHSYQLQLLCPSRGGRFERLI